MLPVNDLMPRDVRSPPAIVIEKRCGGDCAVCLGDILTMVTSRPRHRFAGCNRSIASSDLLRLYKTSSAKCGLIAVLIRFTVRVASWKVR